MGLDFVYGDVKDGRAPSARRPAATHDPVPAPLVRRIARRTSSTRPRLGCGSPTRHGPPRATSAPPSPSTRIRADARRPSAWITDQPWYVYPWRQDPTISSMLVMLDAIHERFSPRARRLRRGLGSAVAEDDSDGDGAIWFLFLPVVDMDYGEDLYIKMNSRGKPLTTFEVFKADFEEHHRSPADPERHRAPRRQHRRRLGRHPVGVREDGTAATS